MHGFAAAPVIERIGRVMRIGDGVARVSGLPDAALDELLQLGDGTMAQAVELGKHDIGCVLLDNTDRIAAGDLVRGTGRVVQVPVGDALLGRIVDPLGRPLDGSGPVATVGFEPADRPAPAIIDRAPVVVPLETGTAVVDAMFAIGRGQRELIIGDRSTGKTTLAVDAIINQRGSDVLCVYVGVGQRASAIKRVIEQVQTLGEPSRCLFVVADAEHAAPGLQWLAPYAGFTMAEYFARQGRDVLVVIDDLTKHADVHRQISLLLQQPPGREAFPGDIFYVHARLLERAAKLHPRCGGGSVTALPIAETQEGNLSAYIPTNLISITDGQIVLDAKLFHGGQKPAVDVGLSVSRVGGKTQKPAMRTLAEPLRLAYAQFLELEVFTHFGGISDERTRKLVEHGRRIRAVLAQPQLGPQPFELQVAMLLALSGGTLDRLPIDRIERFRSTLAGMLSSRPGVASRLRDSGALDDADRGDLRGLIEAAAVGLAAPGGADSGHV
ncbi:MAG TPA: F0F1 ATP synthase subunit alpha [Polyangia bacterium]|nr:F0F1 ATP synthase subunit alpha [Polyangia bacterium]